VNQNYRAFAEAVRSAVDLYRFDLLVVLHLPLPPDSAVEKHVWTDLMQRTVGETQAILTYLHPARDEGDGESANQPDGGDR
jgi:hypothetical protein